MGSASGASVEGTERQPSELQLELSPSAAALEVKGSAAGEGRAGGLLVD